MDTCPPIENRALTADERLATLSRVDELLELTYRSATLGNFSDPLEETVYILLSKQTREVGYQRVHRALRARWPSWQEMMEAPTDDLAVVLRSGGFGTQRASQLKRLLQVVASDCAMRGLSSIGLDWLRELSDTEAESYLISLPGMGTKSARCVMHYALDRHVLAVDTHVARILDRLGIVSERTGKVRHSDYDAVVPRKIAQRLHVNLAHHGRSVCRSTRPRCAACPLISFCRTGRANQQGFAPDRPVAVELFAGGGGLGEGFARAGFFPAIAVELDRHAAQTYRVNHPGSVVLEADATEITGEELVQLAPGAARLTAIIAGPPCQGYSQAGHRKADDDRNALYTAVIDRARELEPRFVVIENVPGMTRVGGQSYTEVVLEALNGAGYEAKAHPLRACDYGVPQLRHRLLFLAQNRKLGPAPGAPRPNACPGDYCEERCQPPGSNCGRQATPTVMETLRGLPPFAQGVDAECVDMGADRAKLLNASTMRHSERVLLKIAQIQPGNGPISYRRLHEDLARTIVAGHRALPVHPMLDRTISVREAARIQGFQDFHVFAGPRYAQPLQVANAVPPPLAQAVASELIEQAGRRAPDSTTPGSTGGPTAQHDDRHQYRADVVDREEPPPLAAMA